MNLANRLSSTIEAINQIDNVQDSIRDSIDLLTRAFYDRQKVLIFGNGGSAADSQHVAAELTCRLNFDRKPLPALALTTDTSFITAYSNDYAYSGVFARQIEALGQISDVAWAISTSGRSENILLALQAAKRCGLKTLILTSNNHLLGTPLIDVLISLPYNNTQILQESFLVIEHYICEEVERNLFAKES